MDIATRDPRHFEPEMVLDNSPGLRNDLMKSFGRLDHGLLSQAAV